MSLTEPATPQVRDVLEEIVAAARRLFASGVRQVRMSDVAGAAGISRAYLYTFVSSREALVELAIVARCEEYGDELEARARDASGDVAAAIVDQLMHGLTLAIRDPEFGRLADELPRTRLAHLLSATDSPIHPTLIRAFEPLLARALSEGRLRTDVALDRIYAWLQSCHGHLASREDLTDGERRQMITDFMLPSLLAAKQ